MTIPPAFRPAGDQLVSPAGGGAIGLAALNPALEAERA